MSKNYIAKVAELYGLELGEVFRLSGHEDLYFMFSCNALLRGDSSNITVWLTEPQDLVDILTGKRSVTKYSSRPKYGDTYYVACPTNVMDMYEIFRWTGSVMDEEYFKRGLVFPTADRAVEASKSIVNMLNGRRTEQLGFSHMRDIIELLGVDFEESFRLDSTTINSDFKFTMDGLYMFSCITEDWLPAPEVLCGLITGTFIINKPKKSLAMGTEYFIPNLTYPSLYSSVTWSAKDFDFQNLKNGLICKTKEEAIDMAKKMLAVIKEEQK